MRGILMAVFSFLILVMVNQYSWGTPTSTLPQQLSSMSYPIWTPCKKYCHVWYLICKTPGVKGCVVDGREIPWSEFVKRANRKAEVVTVERLEDGTVVVWFKW